jgi:hypothetical protein
MQVSALIAACKCVTFAIPTFAALRVLDANSRAVWGKVDCANP